MTRSAIEAYNRLDVEPFLIPFHPEARYEIAPEMAGLGINASDFYVHEGLRRYWEEGRNVWPDLRIDPQELIDLGDQLLMLGKISGKGVRSGIQTSIPYATVATVSNAKVILIREYIDHAEALEAVGLSE